MLQVHRMVSIDIDDLEFRRYAYGVDIKLHEARGKPSTRERFMSKWSAL